MKGYIAPRELITGICFVCGKACDADRYCHFECAWSMSEEKNKRMEEARALERGFRSQQK